MSDRQIETKSRERRAFEHYLRSGRRLVAEHEPATGAGLGVKFNPWHDPLDGQFTFAPGGARSGGNGAVARSDRASKISTRIPPATNGKRGLAVRLPLPADAPYEEVVAEKVKAGATRVWPVAGDGRPARRGEIGPNDLPYSDGRFSPDGSYRTKPDGSPKSHMGVDLPATIGTPVLSAANGKVEGVSSANGYGKIVIVVHEDGTRALYGHLSEHLVRAGDRVTIGQTIGRVGVSGNASGRGSHLHFEITDTRFRPFDKRAKLDPVKWMKRGKG